MKVYFLGLLLIFMASCSEEEELEPKELKGTWNIEWKHCDIYYNQHQGSISFTFNDTTDNVGLLKELKADTLFETGFRFNFTDINTLVIDSIYSASGGSEWVGTHTLSKVTSSTFLLKRATPSCVNEEYKFSK